METPTTPLSKNLGIATPQLSRIYAYGYHNITMRMLFGKITEKNNVRRVKEHKDNYWKPRAMLAIT